MNRERKVTMAVIGFFALIAGVSTLISNIDDTYAAGIILDETYPESEAENACASLGDWVYMTQSEGYGYIMCCPNSENTISVPGGFTPNYGTCQTMKLDTGSCPNPDEYTPGTSGYCDATAKFFKVEGSAYLTVTFNPDGGALYGYDGDKLIEEYVSSYTINYTDEEFSYGDFTAERGDEEFFTGWTLTNDCDDAKETGTYSGTDENITLKACYVDGVWVTFHNSNEAVYSKVLVEPGTSIPKEDRPDIVDTNATSGNGYWTREPNCVDPFPIGNEVTEDMDLYPCYEPASGGEDDEDSEGTGSGGTSTGGSSSGDSSSDDDDSGSSGTGGSSSSGSSSSGSGSGSTGSTDDEDDEKRLTIVTNGGTLYYDGIEYDGDSMSLSYIDHYISYSKFYAISADGDKFIGWEVDDDCPDPTTKGGRSIDRDFTIYACYDRGEEENLEEYTLTLNTDGGTLYYDDVKQSTNNFEVSTFNYNDFSAEKTNSTFLGWDTSSNCNNPLTSLGRLLSDDMDLYACYKTNTTNEDNDDNSGNTNAGNNNSNNNNNTGNNDSNVEQNPNTGSFMLYVVFLIGILSLCYIGYSVFRYVKNNN